MKGSAWFETFAAIFMFLHISIATCLQNYRKKNETTKLLAKSFEKSCARGNYDEKEGNLGNMIHPTRGMKFRKKYVSNKESLNICTYKSFS